MVSLIDTCREGYYHHMYVQYISWLKSQHLFSQEEVVLRDDTTGAGRTFFHFQNTPPSSLTWNADHDFVVVEQFKLLTLLYIFNLRMRNIFMRKFFSEKLIFFLVVFLVNNDN